MNGGMNRALLCLFGGAGAAFMMYPILEDWSLGVMLVFTAAVYGPAGYIIRRFVKRPLWYSGVLISLPLWLLVLSWGLEELRSRPLILACAFVSAYVGTWSGGRAARYYNKVTASSTGKTREYSERGKDE